MNFNKMTKIIALSMTVTVAFTGCSLPFLKKSRVSPDKVFEACTEYDAEDYDDLGEMIEDLGNKRAAANGVFISLEGKNIRHALSDNAVNELFADAGEEVIYSLYSKQIDTVTLMLKSEEKKDGGTVKVALCSAKFDGAEEAEDYYDKCNDLFADLVDKDGFESDIDSQSDDNMAYTITQVFGHAKAVSYSAYLDNDCVMVLIGFERRCNDVGVELESLCDQLAVPAPDMSDWDCLAVPDVDDRLDLFLETGEFTEVNPNVFGDYVGDYDGGTNNYYTETDVEGTMEQLLGIGNESYENVEHLRAAITTESASSSIRTGTYAISFDCTDEQEAETFYNDLSRSLADENSIFIVNQESDVVGDLKYIKLTLRESFSCAIYAVFREGDMVYLVGTMAVEQVSVEDNYEAYVCDAMGLP